MSSRNPSQGTPQGEEPASSAWLELPDGGTFWLTEPLCSIGRSDNKSIILPHSFVSSSHAVIEQGRDGSHTLTDLRSTNGTFLNGRRLSTPSVLTNGAKILIGPFQLTYRCLERRTPGREMSESEGGRTMVQTYNGSCWLLLLDLQGFATRRQELGQDKAEALIRDWISHAKPCIEGHGGVINGQPGDALLAYWRNDNPAAILPEVHNALRELVALHDQTCQERPFRIILHEGSAQITTNATRAEHLASPAVDYLFRIEKIAKPLKVFCLLSEAACKALQLEGKAPCLGSHEVADFPGDHQFFTLPGL